LTARWSILKRIVGEGEGEGEKKKTSVSAVGKRKKR